jgi:hypothetical protein
VVLASTTKYRLPDVARLAHAEVTALRTAAIGS